MSKNENLSKAKDTKNDEFYTRYEDIEKEMTCYCEYDENLFKDKTILLPCDDPEWSNFTKYFLSNFVRFGIKKLISTSYAKSAGSKFISEVERKSPNFDEEKNKTCGKLFIFDKSNITSSQVDYENINFTYLKSDGDFRSDEVKKLRDEADIIVTNPPFSLFREFIDWIFEGKKKFIIIGSTNAITYKEFFPLLKDNETWLGCNAVKEFLTPDGGTQKFGNICWYTNVDHGKRHKEKEFMTMSENLKFNKKLQKKLAEYGTAFYPKYDDYNALEVPFNKAIPSDYNDVMGVPITFLDEYCPEQFEIVGLDRYVKDNPHYGKRFTINGKETYARILIRKKEVQSNE